MEPSNRIAGSDVGGVPVRNNYCTLLSSVIVVE